MSPQSYRGKLDCGDNSCRFAVAKGGMRTNGGCRCIDNLMERIAELEKALADGRTYLDRVVKERGELERCGDAMADDWNGESWAAWCKLRAEGGK